jgi:D-methionine transport system permease protein
MLSLMVNILRSLPFIILLIVMIPFTVLITGTSLGVAGAIPPLVVGATPFFARLVETALREVDRGIIEATQSWARPLARSLPMPCCQKPVRASLRRLR